MAHGSPTDTPLPGISFRRTAVRIGVLAAAVIGAGLAVGLAGLRAPVLLDVRAPGQGQRVGIEGVDVLVRFDPAGRAEPATFRVLLNGADVTDRLAVAKNGAHGVLYGLLDGDNRVRVEIFGRGYWPTGLLVEEARELEVQFRRPLDLDRG